MRGKNGFEDRLLWIVKGTLAASAVLLATGLILQVVQPDLPAARSLLALGLMLLMGIPALRVVIATADRILHRDWYFVIATVIVLVELSLTMYFASRRV